MTRDFTRFVALAALAFGVLSAAHAADEPPKADDAKAATAAEELYRREALKLVGSIDLKVLRDGEWFAVQRIEKPLLLYGDATRGHDRGSVWAWGETGRPVALLELWQDSADRTSWACSLCNTSGGQVKATRGGTSWWLKNASDCELKDLPGAPAPGEAAQRPLQRKALSQKLAGHEFWDPNNSRYELRRLDRPLLTYRDEVNGLLDGGLYVLANGTNPEIVVFVEARLSPSDKTKTSWQFAVGRLAYAELHLDFDGKEVFTGPRGGKLSGRAKPYWVTLLDATPVDDAKE